MSPIGVVGLISSDPWDEVWRRNQHIAVRLVRLGLADRVIYVCPAAKLRHRASFEPERGVRVVTPHLLLPRHRGGIPLLAREVAQILRRADVLWINDAPIGACVLESGVPGVYDVTDDWRTAHLSQRDLESLVFAEDSLARRARTIVCSEVLQSRWLERYKIRARVIQNGVDVAAHRKAEACRLPGRRPHVMYVGTLHPERVDSRLLLEAAASGSIGTIHLVGPDHLGQKLRGQLEATRRIEFHGAVPYTRVPSLMASADALICPHLVNRFTLSLDAIKRFEYLASGRPVVATPTSGFQSLNGYEGLCVVDRDSFVRETTTAARAATPTIRGRGGEHDWSVRAREFAEALAGALQMAVAGGSSA